MSLHQEIEESFARRLDAARRSMAASRLSAAIAAHRGDWHPAVFAAYARAHVAWGGRISPPLIPSYIHPAAREELCRAYTAADLRARGEAGWDNRAHRRWLRRKGQGLPSVLDQIARPVAAADAFQVHEIQPYVGPW